MNRRLNPSALSRRDWLRIAGAGIGTISASGWLGHLAQSFADSPDRKRACILLWMAGGPSQMDTFDLKPASPNGGSFKEIDTATPGIRISQHLPQLARQSNHLALIRSMTTKEGDHSRATYFVRTGYLPQGAVRYPTLGSLISKELGDPTCDLPGFVSIAPYRQLNPAAYEPGFLGSVYAPLMVGERRYAAAVPPAGNRGTDDDLRVDDLQPPAEIAAEQISRRLKVLGQLNGPFLDRHSAKPALSQQAAYARATRLMQSGAGQAFDLADEPEKLRDSYGRNRFGQGCLMARRLIERGVPFVEVTLSGVSGNDALGWDTHADNFSGVEALSKVLDPAWSTLLTDLADRGLLDTTLVAWMGEFGRTPKINENGGRDHFPQAWSTVLSGGGIRGGQAYGRTDADGMTVAEHPVTVPDLLATVCRALGVDPMRQNVSNVGRPIRIADPAAKPIEEVLA